MSVSKELVDIIKGSDDKGTKAYDTPATVTRVDGTTVWVHIPGGVDETPVKRTIDAKQGDTVQVRVSGGSAWLNGNASAPPTDDTQAKLATEYALVAGNAADSAVKSASKASEAAADAKATADSVHGIATQALADATVAKDAADNASEYAARALGNLSTVQSVTETLNWITAHGTMALTTDVALDPTHVYFVVDAGGDYTVGGVTYAIVTEPDVADIGTYYELTIDESLNNYVGTHLALTLEGLWLLPASSGTNRVLIATGAGTQYTVAGTYMIDSSGNTLASFRADGATMTASNGTQIAHLGYGAGNTSGGGTNNAPYYTLGSRKAASANYDSTATYSIGDLVLYNGVEYVCVSTITTPEQWTSSHWHRSIGNYSTAEGINTVASGYGSHAEGSNTVAIGAESHTEGVNTVASGLYSHAEGQYTKATYTHDHAEGMGSRATGGSSHAEGYYTTASGERSHAEGYSTVASGAYSHAEGMYTTASNSYAHVEGVDSVASASSSHAQNLKTIAAKWSQTALGTCNIEDTSATTTHPSGTAQYGQFAVIIGNGRTDSTRSDALEIDWTGDVFLGLDTTAATGTTDGDLYAAIVALGWQSDVIV